MKKLSIITILMFSLGFASTSFSAGKAVDDYLGYSNNPTDQFRRNHDTKDSGRTVHSENKKDTTSIAARGGQNTDDREARRIGKLLWKNDHIHGGHGNTK
ncbi:MAG: hypothetical protein K2Q13_00045 [Nitrosomonas sp.]|uniref:hypothetical protein n=1 Tax=Nitrosomonas sp. TaxID=42353 RepID=UPI0025E8B5D7|nr:hypothetical protein [Nitrosomonas sp.]MBY0473436.1 hypothetical protein [Nitrosomonas sp.]